MMFSRADALICLIAFAAPIPVSGFVSSWIETYIQNLLDLGQESPNGVMSVWLFLNNLTDLADPSMQKMYEDIVHEYTADSILEVCNLVKDRGGIVDQEVEALCAHASGSDTWSWETECTGSMTPWKSFSDVVDGYKEFLNLGLTGPSIDFQTAHDVLVNTLPVWKGFYGPYGQQDRENFAARLLICEKNDEGFCLDDKTPVYIWGDDHPKNCTDCEIYVSGFNVQSGTGQRQVRDAVTYVQQNNDNCKISLMAKLCANVASDHQVNHIPTWTSWALGLKRTCYEFTKHQKYFNSPSLVDQGEIFERWTQNNCYDDQKAQDYLADAENCRGSSCDSTTSKTVNVFNNLTDDDLIVLNKYCVYPDETSGFHTWGKHCQAIGFNTNKWEKLSDDVYDLIDGNFSDDTQYPIHVKDGYTEPTIVVCQDGEL